MITVLMFVVGHGIIMYGHCGASKAMSTVAAAAANILASLVTRWLCALVGLNSFRRHPEVSFSLEFSTADSAAFYETAWLDQPARHCRHPSNKVVVPSDELHPLRTRDHPRIGRAVVWLPAMHLSQRCSLYRYYANAVTCRRLVSLCPYLLQICIEYHFIIFIHFYKNITIRRSASRSHAHALFDSLYSFSKAHIL